MRRNVSFAQVMVREYGQTFGDQPCSAGPPVSLGWDFQESFSADVEEYEAIREGNRRQGHEMKMPASVRVARLMEHGHTRHQINETTAAIRQSSKGEAFILAKRGLESLGRKVRRVVRRGKSTTEEDFLWQQYTTTGNATTSRRFRKSCSNIRRVQSMGEFLSSSQQQQRAQSLLLLSHHPPPTIRGILKTSRNTVTAAREVVSDGSTQDSDSDTNNNGATVVPRSVSLDEKAMRQCSTPTIPQQDENVAPNSSNDDDDDDNCDNEKQEKSEHEDEDEDEDGVFF